MIINKYYLYFIVLFAVLLISMGPNSIHLLTYQKTPARVFGYEEFETGGSYDSRIERFPRIIYTINDVEYTLLAPSFMAEASKKMDSVTVYYDASNPEKAFLFNFYGFWGPQMVFVIPFFLIWTGFVFSPGIIPRRIDLKALEKKLFGK